MADGPTWTNNSKAIAVAELGQDEYMKTVTQQKQVFEKALQKSSFWGNLVIFWKTLLLKAIFVLRTYTTGKRGTHPKGVGAQGFAKVVINPGLPENKLFTPERLFEVRTRHSNFPDALDDTKPNVLSLAIKFADHEEESPLDLICHTGSLSPFFNADSVFKLVSGLKGGPQTTKAYLLSLPVYLDAHIQGIRRVPDSYCDQRYYAQTVYDFKCTDGKKRLARFRIIPTGGILESGKMTTEEQKEAWNMEAVTGTTMKKDYLKQEFAARLKKGHVKYTVQIQIHEFPIKTVPHAMYNASSDWPDSDHPWLDLMNITLTSQLPPDVIEVTRFNIGNHQKDVLGFPKPLTQHDFNVVPYMRSVVYSLASSMRPKEPKEIPSGGFEYEIKVFTEKEGATGTLADVSISLIGSKTRTSFRKLYKRGSPWINKIKDKDVGDILCIKIHHQPTGRKATDWFLSYVTITTKGGKTGRFPCYRWLTDNVTCITLREGPASLSEMETHPYLILLREIEIQERQRMYQWRPKGLDASLEKYPGYINVEAGQPCEALPRDVQFDKMNTVGIEFTRIIGKYNALFGMIKHHLVKFWAGGNATEERKYLLSFLIKRSYTMNCMIENWKSDTEFGRQMLQGINPVKIEQIHELPQNFPVTEDMVEGSLDEGKTLAEEIKAGKVYLSSYPELEEFLPRHSGQLRFMCAPMCLFYAKHKKLVPVAIQLTTKPDENTPIFTKKDDNKEVTYSDWLVAKMWVKVADTNSHQLATHLLGTHLQMEPVAVALLRNLPSMHPLFKLMIPHMRFVVAINTLGRQILIPHGTAISQILAIAEVPGQHVKFMEKMYQKFTYSSLDIPRSFELRGVNDKTLLPGYSYRDDALMMWDAIKQFASAIVNIYYKTDQEVKADEELNCMMAELQANGFHENADMPSRLNKKDGLVHFVTSVIFCCSCQHAAVNFGQLDHYGFSPNAPPCLMMPPPSAKNPKGLDEDGMRKLLPPIEISQKFTGVSNLLSMYSATELFLGEYPDHHFTDQNAQAAIEEFQSRLEEISAAINKRNEGLQIPYEYLLPRKVPNSIAI